MRNKGYPPKAGHFITSVDLALHRLFGFDHGVSHPLLLLYDAKAPNCRKNKAFKGLGHYSEWPTALPLELTLMAQAWGFLDALLAKYACSHPEAFQMFTTHVTTWPEYA